jgi:hypothetical protein
MVILAGGGHRQGHVLQYVPKKRLRGSSIQMHTKKIQLAESQLQGDSTNEEVRDILSDS